MSRDKQKKREYDLEYYQLTKDIPDVKEKCRQRDSDRYHRDPEKHCEYAKNRREGMKLGDESFKGLVLTRARSRSKDNGLEFNITKEDVKWNTKCPVFGVKLGASKTNGKGDSNNSLSLDRIDSTKGYIVGNIRTICNRANKLKNNMTYEECKLIFKNWYKI